MASHSPLVAFPKKVHPRAVFTGMGSSTHPWWTLRWISRWGMSDPCHSLRQPFSLEQLVAWWFSFKQLKQSWCSHAIFCISCRYLGLNAGHYVTGCLFLQTAHLLFSNSTFLSTSFLWKWVWVFPGSLKLLHYLQDSEGRLAFTAKGSNSTHGFGSRELLLSSGTSDGSSATVVRGCS